MEREGLLNFTCVKLPIENTANTSNFPLVSDSRFPRRIVVSQSESKLITSKNMELIGNGVNNLAGIALERKIEVWQDKKFDYEMKLIDTDADDIRRIELIQNCIDSLNDKIDRNKRPRYEE